MKLFIEKYMKLSKDLKDKKGEINAHMKMGMLTSNRGEYEEGRDNFLKALELSDLQGEKNQFSLAKCGFAVASAETNMGEFLKTYAENMKQNI